MAINVLQIAWVMFAAAAVGGLLFVVLSLLRVTYPRWFALGHGALGLLACVVLAGRVLGDGGAASPQARWALCLLVATFLGGALLFGWWRPRRGRLWLALGHGRAVRRRLPGRRLTRVSGP